MGGARVGSTSALLAVRRGHELIHAMDKRLAGRLLLGGQPGREAPGAEDLFSVATKAGATVLD
eukprot:682394-Alexandrium_andersonii.AAC.1